MEPALREERRKPQVLIMQEKKHNKKGLVTEEMTSDQRF